MQQKEKKVIQRKQNHQKKGNMRKDEWEEEINYSRKRNER